MGLVRNATNFNKDLPYRKYYEFCFLLLPIMHKLPDCLYVENLFLIISLFKTSKLPSELILISSCHCTWCSCKLLYVYDYDYSKMKSVKIICFIGNISSFCRIKWDKASEFIEVCLTTIWLFSFKKVFRPVLLQDFMCSRVVLWGWKPGILFCLFPCIMLRTLMPYVCGFASTFCLVLQLNKKKW